LEDALAMLEREQPRLFGLLCRDLGARVIDARVEGERVRIARDGERLVVGEVPPTDPVISGAIWVESDFATIDALLDGETTLLDVVLCDRVRLRASVDELLGAHDALVTFLRAAVRCPSAPELLKRFRDGVAVRTRVPASPVEHPSAA
jgi:hypothetical protein